MRSIVWKRKCLEEGFAGISPEKVSVGGEEEDQWR